MESPVKIWRRQKVTRKNLNKEGVIESWTMIRVSGEAFKDQTPYPVIIVFLKNGNKVMGQLVDYDEKDLKEGTKVTSILRKLRNSDDEQVIPYGLKFRPIS